MNAWDIVPIAILLCGTLLFFGIGYITAKRRIIIIHTIMASIRGLIFALCFVVILLLVALIFYPEEKLLARPTTNWEELALKADAVVIFGYGLGAPADNGAMTPGESNIQLFEWARDHTQSPVMIVQEGVWLAANCDKPSNRQQEAVQTVPQTTMEKTAEHPQQATEQPPPSAITEQPQQRTASSQDVQPAGESRSLVDSRPAQDVHSAPVGEAVMSAMPLVSAENEPTPQTAANEDTCVVNGRKIMRMHPHDDNVYVNTGQAARCAAEKIMNLDAKKRVVVVAHDLQMEQAAWDLDRSLRTLAQYDTTVIVPDVGKIVSPGSSFPLWTKWRAIYTLASVFWTRPRDYLSCSPGGCPSDCN